MTQMTQKLPFHEWIVVSLIITSMVCLTVVTYIYDTDTLPRTDHVHQLQIPKQIKVSIQGAVIKSGVYTIEKGKTIQDLLDLAGLIPDSDTSQLKLASQLRNGQHVYVPSISFITIYLKGAVEQVGEVKVPKGVRLKELVNYVRLLPEADLNQLNKKRKLKDRETIVIRGVNPE